MHQLSRNDCFDYQEENSKKGSDNEKIWQIDEGGN
jgi:hypothetical protein